MVGVRLLSMRLAFLSAYLGVNSMWKMSIYAPQTSIKDRNRHISSMHHQKKEYGMFKAYAIYARKKAKKTKNHKKTKQ